MNGRRVAILGAVPVLLAAAVFALAPGPAAAQHTRSLKTCPDGYVLANLSWGQKCLRAGEFCKVGNPEYHTYGFDCPADGHLVEWSSNSATNNTSTTGAGTTSAPSSDVVGRTVLLARRTRTLGCLLGPKPDRRCSPGAYYSALTKQVICAAGFRTVSIRNVPQSEKYDVEAEYGLPPAHYGRTLEIDHIVSLELGGSNDIANLFPEQANVHPGYHVKDALENRLHQMVCAGQISLRLAQRRIATNWETLYKTVYGVAPTG